MQKQKYDTSLLLLGVHGVRMKLGNRKGPALKLFEIEPPNDDNRSDTNDDYDDDTI